VRRRELVSFGEDVFLLVKVKSITHHAKGCNAFFQFTANEWIAAMLPFTHDVHAEDNAKMGDDVGIYRLEVVHKIKVRQGI